MQDFFNQYGYADCSVAELLALADLSARCGDSEVARTALRQVVQSGRRLHLAYYKLGRMDAAAKDFAAAAENFRAGTAADPSFAYNWMGAARALAELGRKEEACVFAERFVAFGVRPHSDSELTALADLGDFLFDAGDRRRSLTLYEPVVKFGANKPRDAVRLAETFIAQGDFDAAMRVLEAQGKRGRLDPWGRRALAVCCSHAGEHARAVELALAVAQSDPANRGFVVTYRDVLARTHDVAVMRDALARHAALIGPGGAAELTARIMLAESDIEGAASCLVAEDFEYQSRRYHLCLETAYAALGAGLLDLAVALGGRLAGVAPNDTFVKLLRIDSYFRQQMWEQGGDILAGMAGEELEKPHVVLKCFEYASFVGDIPLARNAARAPRNHGVAEPPVHAAGIPLSRRAWPLGRVDGPRAELARCADELRTDRLRAVPRRQAYGPASGHSGCDRGAGGLGGARRPGAPAGQPGIRPRRDAAHYRAPCA
ncbi:MAG: hypothetical protein WDN04_19665 [Rhodospirillales bacterium]